MIARALLRSRNLTSSLNSYVSRRKSLVSPNQQQEQRLVILKKHLPRPIPAHLSMDVKKVCEQSTRTTTRAPIKAAENSQRISTLIIGSIYIMWQCKYLLYIFLSYFLMQFKKFAPTAEFFCRVSKRQRNLLTKINTQSLRGGNYCIHSFTICIVTLQVRICFH